MSSFAEWRPLALAVALAAPLGAQAPAAPLPPVLVARVGADVARTWGVDPDSLVLAWSGFTRPVIADSAGLRLLGRGEGGWFALVVEVPGSPSVALRFRAGRIVGQWVATRPLRPGSRLGADDLRPASDTVWAPPSVRPSATPAPGWVVRRMLAAGDPLDAARVGPPPAVAQGGTVRVLWQEGTIAVALEGVALNDAAVGEAVRVRTDRRSGIIRGTVTAPGEARMN